MAFVINKLNDLVQNQDQEIAELKEQNKSLNKKIRSASNRSTCTACRENENKNFGNTLFGWMRPEGSSGQRDHRDSKLLDTETKLSEQIELNKQLKQYLELMLLKICDN